MHTRTHAGPSRIRKALMLGLALLALGLALFGTTTLPGTAGGAPVHVAYADGGDGCDGPFPPPRSRLALPDGDADGHADSGRRQLSTLAWPAAR